ncbi:GUN4 domain-containing protein [Microseira wollei]|uniref:GUN4 domain-containing protein n=1 Tax=Microseira wollei NIES-4236 TaxID=2530354 RepID=A0AAV3XC83_9CYAN|nr:GUN4 domain-containing protein [Microseira wollei]GET39919.1 hypothetical protein MiSe_46910 [Microseira wollei NIES-4236]
MGKNWAITIGINQYEFLQPLNYAKRDAQLIHDFLRNEAGFERVFFFCDDSPDFNGISTRPRRANLLKFLREFFEHPRMERGDNFWFFFSGHGMRHADRDYLMPADGDPGDVENTAITINYITERLRRCCADNVVLILDACRNQGIKAGEGIRGQTAEEARQTGVISFFSCSPNQYSYEIEELKQGAFTHVLLNSLRNIGQGATVKQLNDHLSRVTELVRQYKNAQQTPYVIAEPINKSQQILIRGDGTSEDITTQNDADCSHQRLGGGKGAKSESPPLYESSEEPQVDYAKLRNLLIAGNWKEADNETYQLILRVLGREQEGWCRQEDISKLPCSVVRKIDQFWVEHSNDKFGFRVQQQIWRNIRGQADKFDVYKLAERIGWRRNNKWLKYDEFTFSLDAKEGHLPSFGYGNHLWHDWKSSFDNFFPRVSAEKF